MFPKQMSRFRFSCETASKCFQIPKEQKPDPFHFCFSRFDSNIAECSRNKCPVFVFLMKPLQNAFRSLKSRSQSHSDSWIHSVERCGCMWLLRHLWWLSSYPYLINSVHMTSMASLCMLIMKLKRLSKCIIYYYHIKDWSFNIGGGPRLEILKSLFFFINPSPSDQKFLWTPLDHSWNLDPLPRLKVPFFSIPP